MDSYKNKNRRHSNHYSYHPSNCRDHSANRDSFDGSCMGSSRADSVSPNSQRKAMQLTFECRVCLNTFQTKRELNVHLHAAQHLRSRSRANLHEDDHHIPSRKRDILGFTCKVCSCQFETHNELMKHLSDCGHHWTAKRSKKMLNQDRPTDPYENYSRRRRHQSATDVRLDKSLDWKNRAPVDTEDERGRSSLSSRSYGSTDLVVDTPIPMPEKDKYVLANDIYNSISEKIDQANVKVSTSFSNFEMDNDQSAITSPDYSVLLQPKVFIDVPSTPENQKGVAVIPTESSIPTDDPRQNFPCRRPDAVRTLPKNQPSKWTPIFCDRPKPNFVEKRIPWKLIPIDFSPISNAGNQHPGGGMSVPTVPSLTEEIQEESIDQLVAQLKENTGATFIPEVRANIPHSDSSFEDNLLTCINRDVISSHVSSTSFSEEYAALQSPTPCVEQANSVSERNSLIKISESSIQEPATVEPRDVFNVELWHPDSTSWSPSSKCDQAINIQKNAEDEVANSLSSAVPISIPLAVIDHQVEADIVKALGTLDPMVNVTPLLPASISIPSCSSQVLSCNTKNMEPSKCTVPVLSAVIESILPGNGLFSAPAIEMRGAEPCPLQQLQISSEASKEKDSSLSHSEDSSTSSESAEEPVVIEEVVESCPCCQTVLDIGCLKIDLKTGNASVHCLECSSQIVMKNVFRKTR